MSVAVEVRLWTLTPLSRLILGRIVSQKAKMRFFGFAENYVLNQRLIMLQQNVS